jgi:ABC-2 type transport system permease protein
LKILNSFKVFKHYLYLLQQLVSRDFKVKYKRSVLGVAWSVLNPLFTMIILDVVFSQLFMLGRPGSGGVKNYPVYLLTGIVLFNYFSEATNLCNGAIVGNFNLITKVYIPKYIFPMSKVLSSAINMVFSLIALYLIVIEETIRSHIVAARAVAAGAANAQALVDATVNITWTHLMLPYVLACMVIFCIGVGLFLSALTVFFRDMFYIWGVVLTAWNYLTPLMYPESILDGSKYQTMMTFIFRINPLYYFVKYARMVVLDNMVPSLQLHAQCLGSALIVLIIGLLFFRKNQNKFIYYI